MRASDERDEILKAIFCLKEEREGPFPKDEILDWARMDADAVKLALDAGLVTEGPGGLDLSEDGFAQATLIVRRHRLAERLLHDVLRLNSRATESVACRFEHVLEGEVTASICTLLGHPRVCPHGKPIPPGPCCANRETNVEAVIQPLSDLGASERGIVAYVHASTDTRIDRLASFGLMPGVELLVHQAWPSVVIVFGETHLALDRETAAEIFVRVAPGEPDDDAGSGRGWGRGLRRRFGRGGRK